MQSGLRSAADGELETSLKTLFMFDVTLTLKDNGYSLHLSVKSVGETRYISTRLSSLGARVELIEEGLLFEDAVMVAGYGIHSILSLLSRIPWGKLGHDQ